MLSSHQQHRQIIHAKSIRKKKKSEATTWIMLAENGSRSIEDLGRKGWSYPLCVSPPREGMKTKFWLSGEEQLSEGDSFLSENGLGGESLLHWKADMLMDSQLDSQPSALMDTVIIRWVRTLLRCNTKKRACLREGWSSCPPNDTHRRRSRGQVCHLTTKPRLPSHLNLHCSSARQLLPWRFWGLGLSGSWLPWQVVSSFAIH